MKDKYYKADFFESKVNLRWQGNKSQEKAEHSRELICLWLVVRVRKSGSLILRCQTYLTWREQIRRHRLEITIVIVILIRWVRVDSLVIGELGPAILIIAHYLRNSLISSRRLEILILIEVDYFNRSILLPSSKEMIMSIPK